MSKRANGEGTICKRPNGTWMCAVTLGYDGKTGKLVRKYAYGKTRAEVLKKKQDMLEKYKTVTFVDADKVTVKNWIEKWLTTYKQNSVKPTTYNSYETVANQYIFPQIGNKLLTKLSDLDCQDMVNAVAKAKSARTANYAATLLRMAIKTAIDINLLQRNPTKTISRPKETKKVVKILTDEQIGQIFNACKQYRDIYMIAVLIFYTGMRRGEALGLKWTNIDLSENIISITHNLTNVNSEIILGTPKTTSSIRKIKIPEKLTALLRRHKKEQSAEILAASEYKNENFLFATENGNPYNPRYITKLFEGIVQKVDIDTTLHQLRHNHATRLFANDWHPKDVQERLGHATVSITIDIYTHYVPARQNEIAVELNKNFIF